MAGSARYTRLQRLKLWIVNRLTHKVYLNHHWTFGQKRDFLETFDPVRYATLMLALRTIGEEKIPGAMAELGVFRGDTSRVLHAHAPERILYLFDTFTGFAAEDLHGLVDNRFKDTTINLLKANLGDLNRVVIRPGRFPETASGLEGERFALVLLDADLYDPTLSGLEFFYPRLVPGGYLFLHDYNSDESGHAARRAAAAYLKDRPECLIEIPDEGGSAVLRKLRTKQS